MATSEPTAPRQGLEIRWRELRESVNATIQEQREASAADRKALDDALAENARLKDIIHDLRSERQIATSQIQSQQQTPSGVGESPTPFQPWLLHRLQSVQAKLTPLQLNPRLPSFVFAADGCFTDGCELPANLLQTLRSELENMLASLPSHDRLNKFSEEGSTSKDTDRACVYQWLRGSGNSAWTAELPGMFACRTCTNCQRLCMSLVKGTIVLLPLPQAIREVDGAGITPTEVSYWLRNEQDASRDIRFKSLRIWSS